MDNLDEKEKKIIIRNFILCIVALIIVMIIGILI